jgi:hypothetical protein
MSLLPAVLALFFGSWAIWWGASSVVEGYQSSTWPQTTYIVFGMLAIIGQFGLLFWIVR